MAEPVKIQVPRTTVPPESEFEGVKNGNQRSRAASKASAPEVQEPTVPPEPPDQDGDGSDGGEPEEATVGVAVFYYLNRDTGAFFYAGSRPCETEFRLYEPDPHGMSVSTFRLVHMVCQIKPSDLAANPQILAALEPGGVFGYFRSNWNDFFPGTVCPYSIQVVRGGGGGGGGG